MRASPQSSRREGVVKDGDGVTIFDPDEHEIVDIEAIQINEIAEALALVLQHLNVAIARKHYGMQELLLVREGRES